MISFSQPKSFKFIANHGEKIFYALLFLGIFQTYQDLKDKFLLDVIILITMLFLLLFIVGRFLKRVIWKFDLDFDRQEIFFYLCRTKKPIKINFSEIDYIKVNGPIIFFIKQKKFLYSTNQYTETLKILQKIKKIKWGRMCDILGPKKEIRDQVDSERPEKPKYP